eukprot:4115306-Pyramimonas_sp.AAC.1
MSPPIPSTSWIGRPRPVPRSGNLLTLTSVVFAVLWNQRGIAPSSSNWFRSLSPIFKGHLRAYNLVQDCAATSAARWISSALQMKDWISCVNFISLTRNGCHDHCSSRS